MTEKEKMYLEKFGKEYLNLRETIKNMGKTWVLNVK